MGRIDPELLAFSVLLSLLICVLFEMVWTWASALWTLWKKLPLLPYEGATMRKPVPWGGVIVLSLVLLYVGMNVAVSRAYALATGRKLPHPVSAASDHPRAGDPNKGIAEPVPDRLPPDAPPEQSFADLMLQSALSNCLLLALVPGYLRLTSGAQFADLGIHGGDWRRPFAVGGRAALLMTPPVCAVQFVAAHIWKPQTHPVEQMVIDSFTPGVAMLAVLSTTVLAPLVEELLFRGIFQRWLDRLVETANSTSGLSVAKETTGLRRAQLEVVDSDSNIEPRPEFSPGAGTESPAFNKDSLDQLNHGSSALPIVLTSFFFAAMHMPQWPAPLGIFLLSIGLGIVYQRTGSLFSSVAMHATFNGVNTLLLLLTALGHNMQSPP